MNRNMQDIVIKPERHRWFVWRDIVAMLLAVAVVMLIRQVDTLRTQLDRTAATNAQHLTDLNGQLQTLQGRLKTAQYQSALKDSRIAQQDRRIKQLTDQLLKAGLEPVRATSAASPSPVPHPSGPTPVPSRSGSPTPSPTCMRIPALGICQPGRN